MWKFPIDFKFILFFYLPVQSLAPCAPRQQLELRVRNLLSFSFGYSAKCIEFDASVCPFSTISLTSSTSIMTRIFHKTSSVCSIHPSRVISCSFNSPQTSPKVKTLLTKTASAPPLNTPWASCSASPPNWTTYRHGCLLSPFSLPDPLPLHTPSPVILLCPSSFQMLPTQYVPAERDKTLKVSRSETGTGSRSRDSDGVVSSKRSTRAHLQSQG
jgi:hypothetical protein